MVDAAARGRAPSIAGRRRLPLGRRLDLGDGRLVHGHRRRQLRPEPEPRRRRRPRRQESPSSAARGARRRSRAAAAFFSTAVVDLGDRRCLLGHRLDRRRSGFDRGRLLLRRRGARRRSRVAVAFFSAARLDSATGVTWTGTRLGLAGSATSAAARARRQARPVSAPRRTAAASTTAGCLDRPPARRPRPRRGCTRPPPAASTTAAGTSAAGASCFGARGARRRSPTTAAFFSAGVSTSVTTGASTATGSTTGGVAPRSRDRLGGRRLLPRRRDARRRSLVAAGFFSAGGSSTTGCADTSAAATASTAGASCLGGRGARRRSPVAAGFFSAAGSRRRRADASAATTASAAGASGFGGRGARRRSLVTAGFFSAGGSTATTAGASSATGSTTGGGVSACAGTATPRPEPRPARARPPASRPRRRAAPGAGAGGDGPAADARGRTGGSTCGGRWREVDELQRRLGPGRSVEQRRCRGTATRDRVARGLALVVETASTHLGRRAQLCTGDPDDGEKADQEPREQSGDRRQHDVLRALDRCGGHARRIDHEDLRGAGGQGREAGRRLVVLLRRGDELHARRLPRVRERLQLDIARRAVGSALRRRARDGARVRGDVVGESLRRCGEIRLGADLLRAVVLQAMPCSAPSGPCCSRAGTRR